MSLHRLFLVTSFFSISLEEGVMYKECHTPSLSTTRLFLLDQEEAKKVWFLGEGRLSGLM